MTVSPLELVFYAGAILLLFLTPGPVWVALMARALSGGFVSAAPLAVGVAIGDMVWPLAAIFGLSWVVTTYAGVMDLLRWVAVGMFLVMGFELLRRKGSALKADSRLLRPGPLAGFLAGIAVILANPKAILFYMGVLPGFFDLTRITPVDIAAIIAISVAVPIMGNLAMALMIDRMRSLLRSPAALTRLNRISGALLMLVGVVIALG
jgi:threonine/homoserine/homoserine lactone efflux protein